MLKTKIRLIVKRNEIIRGPDGEVKAVTVNYETRDYELKDSLLDNFSDGPDRKYEIVSAEFV